MIVRELFARLGMDVDGSGFSKAGAALAKLHLALGGIRDIVHIVRGALEGLANGTADAAKEIERTSRITGLSTDEVQAWGYAAQRSGISADEMRLALVHLARGAQEASFGSGAALQAFYRLGIQAADAHGKAKPLGELLPQIAARFAAMPDSGQKAAMAVQIFGRAGAELIPLLDKGPAGVAELAAQAKKLGLVLDKDALLSARRYRASLAEMKGALEGVQHSIAERVFPVLTDLNNRFRDFILTHRRWLSLKIKEAFEVLGRVLETFGRATKYVVDLFERLWNSGTLGKAVLGGLGYILAGMISPAGRLAGILALIAEDVGLFVSSGGKAKTLTGVLLQFFELVGHKLNEMTGGFFDGFIEEAKKLPARIRKEGIARGILSALLGTDPGELAGQFNSGPGRTTADDSFLQRGARSALTWLLGGPDWGALGGISTGALASIPPMLMRPELAGGSSPFVATFNMTLSPGAGGKEFAEDFFSAALPKLEEWHDSKLRTAADHVSKNRSR